MRIIFCELSAKALTFVKKVQICENRENFCLFIHFKYHCYTGEFKCQTFSSFLFIPASKLNFQREKNGGRAKWTTSNFIRSFNFMIIGLLNWFLQNSLTILKEETFAEINIRKWTNSQNLCITRELTYRISSNKRRSAY